MMLKKCPDSAGAKYSAPTAFCLSIVYCHCYLRRCRVCTVSWLAPVSRRRGSAARLEWEGVTVCPAAPLRFATGYRDIAPRGAFSRLSGDFCLGISVAELYFAPQRVTETSPFQGFFAGCSRGAAAKRSRKMGWGAFVTTSCAPPTGRLHVATDKMLLRSIIGGYAAVRRPD